MNKDTAKDYLPLVQALAEGKTIQIADPELGKELNWVDAEDFDFCLPISFYRIKPEPKKGWYRVALLRDSENFQTATHDSGDEDYFSMEDHAVEIGMEFVRWLTDRIEYTIPEGDA